MNIIERAKGIILKPSETWQEIKREQISIGELYTSYAVILAAIPAIAQFIGMGLIGYSFMGVHFRIGIGNALGYAISSYVLSLVGIYVAGFVVDTLAPSFSSQRDMVNACKSVVYSMTPVWVAGVFYIIPPLSVLVILAGIYGIYLFYLGLPLLMETPKEKALGYVIVVIIVTIIINFVFGMVANSIFIRGQMGMGMMVL
ncbi:MAG: Yip1 family protein [Thermodesulfovibrionia bacterium]